MFLLNFLYTIFMLMPLSFGPHISQKEIFSNINETTGEVILKNEHICLKFKNEGKYSFNRFICNGENILPDGGSETDIWHISLLGPRGETPSLTPEYAFYDGIKSFQEGDTSYIVIGWRLMLEGKSNFAVNVKVSLDSKSVLPEWNLSVELPEGWIVKEVVFPTISFKTISGPKAILPEGYGIETDLKEGFTYESRYPSHNGGMQLVMVHDNKHTLYYSSKDKTGAGKLLSVTAESGKIIFSQKVTASYSWSENRRFELPWSTVAGLSDCTWEETAVKWYRPFVLNTMWGSKSIKDRSIVKWIVDSDLWLRPMGVSEKTITALNKALDFYGKGVGLHWYYWHKYDFDTHYPDYFPAKKGFKEIIKAAHAKGAHITPYINGRLWDAATESYISERGIEASCKRTDGTLYTEVYSSKAVNTVTCPSSAIWQDKLKETCTIILNELGTDGVYFDQIAAAKDEPCYADNHGHPKGGGSWWSESYRKLTKYFRQNIFGEENAITSEENAECYINMFDMLLIVNTPHTSSKKIVPLFPLIYSDRCIYSGFTYIPKLMNDGSFRYITMMSLLWGAQLGWVDPEILMEGKNHIEAQFLKNLVCFREKNHDLFVGGRFLRYFPLSEAKNNIVINSFGETSEVMAAEWLSTDGKKSFVVVNMGQKDSEIVINGKNYTISSLKAIRI